MASHENYRNGIVTSGLAPIAIFGRQNIRKLVQVGRVGTCGQFLLRPAVLPILVRSQEQGVHDNVNLHGMCMIKLPTEKYRETLKEFASEEGGPNGLFSISSYRVCIVFRACTAVNYALCQYSIHGILESL